MTAKEKASAVIAKWEEVRPPYATAGMDLRDYFAAAIASGCAAISDERTYSSRADFNDDYAPLSVEQWREAIVMDDARYAYRMADALLKVREECKVNEQS